MHRPKTPDKVLALVYGHGMAGARAHLLAGRRIVAAILLLVISVHAAQPLGISLDRSPGSAFSAATTDVSLASGQGTKLARLVSGIDPPVPAPIAFIRPANATRLSASPEALAKARGPPANESIFSPLSPRAPPAA